METKTDFIRVPVTVEPYNSPCVSLGGEARQVTAKTIEASAIMLGYAGLYAGTGAARME